MQAMRLDNAVITVRNFHTVCHALLRCVCALIVCVSAVWLLKGQCHSIKGIVETSLKAFDPYTKPIFSHAKCFLIQVYFSNMWLIYVLLLFFHSKKNYYSIFIWFLSLRLFLGVSEDTSSALSLAGAAVLSSESSQSGWLGRAERSGAAGHGSLPSWRPDILAVFPLSHAGPSQGTQGTAMYGWGWGLGIPQLFE